MPRAVETGSPTAGQVGSGHLPLPDRVLLAAAYWRTNLTLCRIGPLFGVSYSAAYRVLDTPACPGTRPPAAPGPGGDRGRHPHPFRSPGIELIFVDTTGATFGRKAPRRSVLHPDNLVGRELSFRRTASCSSSSTSPTTM
ncbi:hypothetical protein FRAHR75_330020 [Frankia sp. Hr75.2]|nr:hypothetical protein FRAHR75_330020 [Frankia sp. Hr75.2]